MGRPRLIRSAEEQAVMRARARERHRECNRERNRERAREPRADTEVRHAEVEAGKRRRPQFL